MHCGFVCWVVDWLHSNVARGSFQHWETQIRDVNAVTAATTVTNIAPVVLSLPRLLFPPPEQTTSVHTNGNND